MRIEYLSNHPLKMTEKAVAQYEVATLEEARRYADLMQAQRSEQQVLKTKKWWHRLVPLPTVAEQAAHMKLEEARVNWEDAQAKQKRLANEVRQWKAGVDGEQAFDKAVEDLSDDWVLFAGYRNRKGEADKILLGPEGLWVIEVKNINAWIHVSGSHWIHERLDKDGLPVRKKAADNTGRTWGQQVNDVAQALDIHLQRNGVVIPLRTAIVLTHPEALVLQNRNADVDLVGRPAALLHAMKVKAWPVSSETALTVEELIRKDHAFNNPQKST